MEKINMDDFFDTCYKKIEILEIENNYLINQDNTIVVVQVIYEDNHNHSDNFFDFLVCPKTSTLELISNLNYFQITSENNRIRFVLGVTSDISHNIVQLLLLALAWEFDFIPKDKRQSHTQNLNRFLIYYKVKDLDYFNRHGMPIKYHEKQVVGFSKEDNTSNPRASI